MPPVPDWSKLRDEDGSAEDLPELLASLTPDPSDPGWGELWRRLYHQGNTYSASPYVLPYLLDIAAGASAAGQVQPLFLASHIVASPEFRFAGEAWAETVGHLHSLAETSAADPYLAPIDRVYLLSAMLTLGGDPISGQALQGLADGELQVNCPQCGVYTALLVDAIDPIDLAHLSGVGQLLQSFAIRAGDAETALGIRKLFGRFNCLECGAAIHVAEAVQRWQRGAG